MGEGVSKMNKGQKTPPEKKVCSSCDKSKVLGDFFLSNNDFHKKDLRFPVCKICAKDSIDYDDMQTIFDLLNQMNRPFLIDKWNSSIAESEKTGKDLFGLYYKNIILTSKHLSWKNSVFENNNKKENSNISTEPRENHNLVFDVTREMILRWGSNYENEDYYKLEDFYNKMKLSNRIETQQEETYLIKLAVISLKMDKELDQGNTQQVKQLGDLFSKFMADSKFRAMDKTEADKTGGIRNFSTIYSETEKDGHIPPWSYYREIKGLTQDIVDKTIMHIENFTLRLNKIERMTEPPSDTPKIDES